MTKQELMETYTAKQLAEMIITLESELNTIRNLENEVLFEERIVENIRKTTGMNIDDVRKTLQNTKKYMNDEHVKELQSEVEKYRKAFENAKKERDCQICEYQKKIDDLKGKLEIQMVATKYAEEYVNSLKNDLDRTKTTVDQIDDILEKIFGVRHDVVAKPDEFEKILSDRTKGNITDFLPTEPIKVADMLINSSKKRTNCMTGKEYDKYIFEKWQLRQIAEHLLVYCNHNGEAEE